MVAFCHDSDDRTGRHTDDTRWKQAVRLGSRQNQSDDIRFVGIHGKRTAKMLILGIFAGRIDDEIAVADILGLMIMNGFAAQRLNERTLSGFAAADQDQFFHVYVLVIAQTLKPSARSAYSVTAARLASTSSTFPVTMSVPLNRSTKPSSAADFLIARSAAMIAYSAGRHGDDADRASCVIDGRVKTELAVKNRVRRSNDVGKRNLFAGY